MGRAKKIIASLFLGISIIPMALLFALQLSKAMNRYAIKEQLEHSQLQKIILPVSEVNWIKAGKEIIVEGEMFDVQHMQALPNNQIAFYGLSDKKEDQLNKEVDVLMNKRKGSETNVIKGVLWEMVDLIPTNISTPAFPLILKIEHASYLCDYFSINAEINVPPPKRLSIF